MDLTPSRIAILDSRGTYGNHSNPRSGAARRDEVRSWT
jgi:hypothetical protein